MPHGHRDPVNLGLLGSGFVAEFYMDALGDVPGAHVVANHSRSSDRAREFGERHDVTSQYTDVEALCADVAELGVGTHDAAHLSGRTLEEAKVLGSIHVAFGASAALGGRVSVPVHVDCVVLDATLELDGLPLLRAGRLLT